MRAQTQVLPSGRVCLIKAPPGPEWAKQRFSYTSRREYSHFFFNGPDWEATDWVVGISRSDFVRPDGSTRTGDLMLSVLPKGARGFSISDPAELRPLLALGPLLAPGLADALREAAAVLGWEVPE